MFNLVARREWELLDAVKQHKIPLGELFDAHRACALDALRQRLNDVDLAPLVDEWLAIHGPRLVVRSRQQYRTVLRRLIPEGQHFSVASFTAKNLEGWLAEYPGSNATKRKAHAVLSVFARYLVRQEHIAFNPLRELSAAAASKPRMEYLTVEQMTALADAQPEPYQSLSAFLHGTGADLSTALALVAGDVDLSRKEVRARGTKNHNRDRIVRVAEWSWPYVLTRVAQLKPHERLFETDRWRSRDHHATACKALSIENYWVRDARHSYAVRAARAGTPAELIAKQLGHANATMVLKVYGRFMSEQGDRDCWELAAAAMDVKNAPIPFPVPDAQATSTVESTKSPNPLGLDDFESSRGGTRTRDPGIMSAVL